MRSVVGIVCVLLVIAVVAAMVVPQQRVDGGELLVTYRRLQPAGETLEFYGRPVDVVLSEGGSTLFIKDRAHLRVVNTETWDRGRKPGRRVSDRDRDQRRQYIFHERWQRHARVPAR